MKIMKRFTKKNVTFDCRLRGLLFWVGRGGIHFSAYPYHYPLSVQSIY